MASGILVMDGRFSTDQVVEKRHVSLFTESKYANASSEISVVRTWDRGFVWLRHVQNNNCRSLQMRSNASWYEKDCQGGVLCRQHCVGV